MVNSKRFTQISKTNSLERESNLSLSLIDMIYAELKHPTIYISGISYYLTKHRYCTESEIREYLRAKCAALARRDMVEYDNIALSMSIFLLLVVESESESATL